MTTIQEMEQQIAALQTQVRFLLDKVGGLPLRTGNPFNKPIAKYRNGAFIKLQKLETDGCTSLKEWLEVHDTSKLFPGHCVQFTEQYQHTLQVTEYVFGWEQLEEQYNQRLRFNRTASMQQWQKNMCPNDWAVLESTQLRTDRGVK